MPIDTTVPESPGWWLKRLSKKLLDRQPRLVKLDAYYRGDPPLPTGAENAKPAYQAFQRKARTNFAELAVEATRHRMTPNGIRTAVDGSETGDGVAWQQWQTAGMDVKVADVLESMLSMGDGYMIGGLDSNDGLVITAEDPRQVVTAHDPMDQRRVVAALKVFHDPIAEKDLAYLFLPGRLRVAFRAGRRVGTTIRFNPSSWEWDEELSADLPAGLEDVVPVVRFRNKRGVGEFEPHIDILDRINHMLLQRMVIATMQAFRQRAIKGDLPTVYPPNHPQAGELIDYDAIFTADPGALWMIPGAAEIWESGQADLTPILSSVKDDVLHFAAVTMTPLAMFSPESANQTAEGATAAREGHVFKVDDRIMRAKDGLIDVLALAFRLKGDAQRAQRDALSILWAPVERLSLAEKADASAKAGADLPLRAKLIDIWQIPPSVADRYLVEIAQERAASLLVAGASNTLPGVSS